MTMQTPSSGTFPAGGSSALGVKEIAWARLAAGIAKGGEELLRKRFAAARGAGIPARWIEELLLQSFLNVGYPLTLAAFGVWREIDRKSTRLNSSHPSISYAVFCLKKKKKK